MLARLISTRAHGVLDLVTAGTLVALPRAMGWSDRVTKLLTMAGVGAVGYSLLTRYEFGLLKVLPMRAHLALDLASGASLCAAAAVLSDEPDEVRQALLGLGLFEVAAALTTDPVSPQEEADAALETAGQEALAW